MNNDELKDPMFKHKPWRTPISEAIAAMDKKEETDKTNPTHYKSHPSGVECIQITEHMSFCLGNVVKYVWRADMKDGIGDLKKARWYLEREIALRTSEAKKCEPITT